MERKERFIEDGGGVLIAVKTGIPYARVDLPVTMEAIAVQIYTKQPPLCVCSLYIPPDYSNKVLEKHLNKLIELLPTPFLICADANAHHISWGSEYSKERGNIINKSIEDNGLVILNTGEPTHVSPAGIFTHIDLTIAKANIASKLEWRPQCDLYNSDHFPVVISSNLELPNMQAAPRWNVDKANWKDFQECLNLSNIRANNPTETYQNFINRINEAASRTIPITHGSSPKSRCKSWWTTECTAAQTAKNRALSRYKRNRGKIEYFIEFKRCRAIFRQVINEAKQRNFNDFINGIQPNTNVGKIWKKVKAMNNTRSNKTVLLKDDGRVISDPAEVSEQFANHFAIVSSGRTSDSSFEEIKNKLENTTIVFSKDNRDNYNKSISFQELKLAINSCNSKSTGPDKIPFQLFKQLSDQHVNELLGLFNYIFNTGIPDQWRESIVIPIVKPNKNTSDPNSYRPIALTNCSCKIMEKILNWRLQRHLEKNLLYTPFQSGFRAAHSTLDAITRVESEVRKSLMLDQYTVAVFLDISHAFDTVWQQGLRLKLLSIGLKGNMVHFIENFLANCQMRVKVGSTMSSEVELKAGVPQGSVISPTLFTIYINDLFKTIPADISHSLYADDGAMWVSGRNIEELLSTMQRGLREIENWSHKWGLEFSSKKTKAIIFTHKHLKGEPTLILNNQKIEFVHKVKYLGLHFDRQLTWKFHIKQLADKCSRDIQLLRVVAGCRWGASYLTLKKLYLALIRSKLEYASFIYDTAAKSNLLLLDRVQYSAIRVMTGAMRCTNVYKLETAVQIIPLSILWKRLLVQYMSCILRIPEHPVRKLYLDYYPFDFIVNNKRPLSAIGRAYREFTAINLDVKNIPTVPQYLQYEVYDGFACSSLACINKATITDQQWRQLVTDMVIQNYSGRTLIFSDGSVVAEKVGCGVWSESFSLKMRPPNEYTIFTAELYAIYTSIKFIEEKPGFFLILTDSLSSVKALQSCKVREHYLVLRISELLKQMPKGKVIIEWIPSHNGVPGNEKADKLARDALSLNIINNISYPKKELQKRIAKYYYSLWQTSIAKFPTETRNIDQVLSKTKNKKHQKILSRFYLGVNRMSHGHHIFKTSRECCTHCKCYNTVEHLLIECPYYDAERSILTSAITDLHKPLTIELLMDVCFPQGILLQYLSTIGYINRI